MYISAYFSTGQSRSENGSSMSISCFSCKTFLSPKCDEIHYANETARMRSTGFHVYDHVYGMIVEHTHTCRTCFFCGDANQDALFSSAETSRSNCQPSELQNLGASSDSVMLLVPFDSSTPPAKAAVHT